MGRISFNITHSGDVGMGKRKCKTINVARWLLDILIKLEEFCVMESLQRLRLGRLSLRGNLQVTLINLLPILQVGHEVCSGWSSEVTSPGFACPWVCMSSLLWPCHGFSGVALPLISSSGMWTQILSLNYRQRTGRNVYYDLIPFIG